MASPFRTTAFCSVVALSLATVSLAPAAHAQNTNVAAATPSRLSLEELTAQWASLERPLLGVTDLTDTQRDAIELLEEKYRKAFLNEATPIRNARTALMQNRENFARQDVERALDRITSLRKQQLALMREVLTDAQRVRYNENLKVMEAEEAAAKAQRERDEAFYVP
jgi:Spy/CpxP family protein refolding chaperone